MAAPMEEEDDFGDFGVFEAAEPVPVPQQDSPSAQAAPNVWASMFAPAVQGTSNVQPDLLCGQDRFPQHLDNPVSVDVTQTTSHAVDVQDDGLGAGIDDLGSKDDDDDEFDLDSVNLANDILDGSFKSSSQSGTGLQTERMPDISGLDLAAGISAMSEPSALRLSDNDFQDVPSSVVNGFKNDLTEEEPKNAVSLLANEKFESTNQVTQQAQTGFGSEASGEALSQQVNNNALLTRAREEKAAVEKELEEQQQENARLSGDLSRAQELAEATRKSYEELQTKHREELEKLQAGGHESLTVIIEEYKALLQATVQQQQEVGERRYAERLKEEADKWREKLDRQKEEFDRNLEAERQKNREHLQEVVEQMKEKQKEEFESLLQRERQNLQEEIQTELKKERDVSAAELQKASKLEQENAKEQLKKQQEICSQKLADEIEKHRRESELALTEQKNKYEDQLKTAIQHEREQARETSQLVSQQVRDDMKRYLQEQRESDRTIQLRQLASLDLFLESARHQLSLLMTGDPKPRDSRSRRNESGDSA